MNGMLCSLAVMTLLAAAPDPGQEARRPIHEEISQMKPFSQEGGRLVVGRMHQGLVQPPGQVEADARAVCARFLPRVVPTVLKDGGASCALKLDALEALAMCHYLAGSLRDARKAVSDQLALLRCDAPGARGDGLTRAVALAERWFWPEIVLPLVKARVGKGNSGADPQMVALDLSRRLKISILRALGKRKVTAGLVVASVKTGSPAAGAGLMVGDVILTAGARPVKSGVDLRAVTRKSSGDTTLVYMRDGKPKDGVLRGTTEGLVVRALPERFAR